MEKLVTDSDGGTISQGDQLLVDGNSYKLALYVFLQEHNPDDIKEYLKDKNKEIFTGSPVWKRRAFDANGGVMYDLYVRQNHFASINYKDGVVVAYVMSPEPNKGPIVAGTFDQESKEKNLIEAITKIEALLPDKV